MIVTATFIVAQSRIRAILVAATFIVAQSRIRAILRGRDIYCRAILFSVQSSKDFRLIRREAETRRFGLPRHQMSMAF
jgi:hypothetical protein